MSQQDIFFLVMVLIGLSTLTLFVAQLFRSRKKDDRGAWYEGPWDGDQPRDPRQR